ncbi:MAG: ATP-binding cassette domain-containing protein [Deltaproteobacteria bacterium]|nr:ATP-binding cassette domain-containing protein [Deltaproteobacteria bacterium]
MSYSLNTEFNFTYDPFSDRGYIISNTGALSVVNGDAIIFLENITKFVQTNSACSAFLEKALEQRWIIKSDVSCVSIRKVVTPYHLKRVQLELLLRCNLICEHCYCAASPKSPMGPDKKTVFKLIKEARAMGVLFFDITGGEPLIRKDIFEILDFAHSNGLVTSIFTNGTLLDKTRVLALKKTRISNIQTSLDAYTSKLHDSFRGSQGAYQKTINGIRLLKEHGINVSVTIMVNRRNHEEIQTLVHYIKTVLQVPFRLDRVIPVGRALWNEDLALSNSEYTNLMTRLFSDNDILNTKVCKSTAESSCGVGTSYMFIKQNMDVVLCPTLSDREHKSFLAGNCQTTALSEIWMNSPTFKQYRGIQCKNIAQCSSSEKCHGGCRSNAYLLNGELTAPDKCYCKLYKKHTVIKVTSLSKHYRIPDTDAKNGFKSFLFPTQKNHEALKEISFSALAGEALAILGPNGAGKSTLIKILSGILMPTRGQAEVLGYCPWKSRMAYTANIGLVMGQKSLLYWDIPVIDSLRLFKEIYNLSYNTYERNFSRLDEIFKISSFLKIPAKKLSLGQRMKCEIIASVIHMPKLLFLDEPTIGLDLPTKIALLDYLKVLRKETCITVLLATHSLQEVEYLCSRILILNQGRFIFDGSLRDLKSKIPNRQISFQVKEIINPSLFQITSRRYGFLPDTVFIEFSARPDEVSSILKDIMAAALIDDIRIEEPTIDQAIKEYFI